MGFRKFAVILPVAALITGCQPEKNAGRQQELEQRVQQLERQLLEAQTASPSPAAPETWDPSPAPRVATVPVERTRTVARAPAPPRSAPPVVAPTRSETASAERPRTEPYDMGDDDEGYDARRKEAVVTRPTSMVLPEGTELQLVLEQALSSATSHAGDEVVARVERATSEDGRILLPGGTVLHGRVSEARPSGRVSGRARVALDFDRIVVRGLTHELDVATVSVEAPGEGSRDAKIVGGSAAAGAVLGAISNGSKGAVKGAVIGAGAGGVAVLVTKGKEIELPAGSRWTVRLRNSVRL